LQLAPSGPTLDAGGLGLSLQHVGGPVVDLDAAVDEHRSLGFDAWVRSPSLELTSFDGEIGRFVRQSVRMAFGRGPSGLVVELIHVDPSTEEGPQARLLATHPGLSHVAFWCEDVPRAASLLLGEGASLVTAASPDPERWQALHAAQGVAGLLPELGACYLRLISGALVELVPTSLWGAPLEAVCGAGIGSILPAPPAHGP